MCEALSRRLGARTMIQTMFLCAGLGTRLLPLTRELPKPMVPLGDKPVLGHLLERLREAGGRLRAVNTHHLNDRISSFVDSYSESIHVSHEEVLRGTAGGVWAARSAFDSARLLIWNSDILTRPRIADLASALDRGPVALAVELLSAGQGNVGLDELGRVVRLRQQAIGTESAGGRYVGIMALRHECLEAMPAHGCLVGDFAIPLMQRGQGLVAVAHAAPWSDLGSLRAYLDENIRWLKDEHGGQSWIEPSAKVGRDVELRECVVGAGAAISGKGLIERVVVWPHAHCEAPLSNAIVTPVAGVVPVQNVD